MSPGVKLHRQPCNLFYFVVRNGLKYIFVIKCKRVLNQKWKITSSKKGLLRKYCTNLPFSERALNFMQHVFSKLHHKYMGFLSSSCTRVCIYMDLCKLCHLVNDTCALFINEWTLLLFSSHWKILCHCTLTNMAVFWCFPVFSFSNVVGGWWFH